MRETCISALVKLARERLDAPDCNQLDRAFLPLVGIALTARAYRAALHDVSAAIAAGEGASGLVAAERAGEGLDDALAAFEWEP